jgi:hypothetical protein
MCKTLKIKNSVDIECLLGEKPKYKSEIAVLLGCSYCTL